MSESQPTLWVTGPEPEHDIVSTKTYGFWLYMMSDALIFAGLFAAYGVLNHKFNAAGGPDARDVVHPVAAFWQTIVLFASVLATSVSVACMKTGSRSLVLLGLLVAGALGIGFLGLELHDFATLIAQGATPERSGYLSMFFLIIAAHGLHIAFGLLWLGVMIVQVAWFGFTTAVVTRLLTMQMFWQFQAAIWVCMFVFVYLQGTM